MLTSSVLKKFPVTSGSRLYIIRLIVRSATALSGRLPSSAMYVYQLSLFGGPSTYADPENIICKKSTSCTNNVWG